jgi:hypothetical protein
LSATSEIKIKNIDHLAIVAGLIDEIGIVEIINNKLGIDKREKISRLNSSKSYSTQWIRIRLQTFIFVQPVF